VGSRLSVLLVSAVINPQGTPARVVEAVMSGRVVAVVTEGLLDELAAVLIRPKFRRWITVALGDAAGTAIVTGDADLLDAGIDPPAITPRNLIDALTR